MSRQFCVSVTTRRIRKAVSLSNFGVNSSWSPGGCSHSSVCNGSPVSVLIQSARYLPGGSWSISFAWIPVRRKSSHLLRPFIGQGLSGRPRNLLHAATRLANGDCRRPCGRISRREACGGNRTVRRIFSGFQVVCGVPGCHLPGAR